MIRRNPGEVVGLLSSIFEQEYEDLPEVIDSLELKAEGEISELLSNLGVTHLVELSRNLPAQKSLERKRYFTPYFSNVYDIDVLKRMFARDILQRGQCNLRYYVSTDPIYLDKDVEQLIGFNYVINWCEDDCN